MKIEYKKGVFYTNEEIDFKRQVFERSESKKTEKAIVVEI